MMKAKKIHIPETKDEWLQIRLTGIGGSDAGVILGFSPYKSSYTLWAEKTGICPAEDKDNEAMRQGRDFEDYVARRFTELTGKRVKKTNFMYRSEDHPFMLATVDRLIIGEKAGLECKTAGILSESKFLDGNVPSSYYAQCMHYMEVTGLKKWYIAVLIYQRDFIIYEIDYDPDWAAAMVQAEELFWNRVQRGQAPDPDGSESTAKTLQRRYPESLPTVLMAEEDDRLERLCLEYQSLDTEIKRLKEQQEQIKNHVKSEMEAADTALTETWKVTWKTQNRTSVDSKKLKAKYPDVYDDVKKESNSRIMRFALRKEKK